MKKNTVRRRPSKVVNLLFLLVGMLCFVYYFANGFLIRFGQSLLWLWPLIGTALLVRFALVARMIRTGRPSPLPRGFLHHRAGREGQRNLSQRRAAQPH